MLEIIAVEDVPHMNIKKGTIFYFKYGDPFTHELFVVDEDGDGYYIPENEFKRKNFKWEDEFYD